MGFTHTIVADGNSPLTRWTKFLQSVSFWLPRFLERDVLALQILTEPALPQAIQRAEEQFWRRQAQQRGRKATSPRIWTRSDEREVNIRRGLASGWHPSRRVDRAVDRYIRLRPELFASTIREASQDQLIPLVGSEIKDSNDKLVSVLENGKLLAASRQRKDERDAALSAWEQDLAELDRFVLGFFDYLKRATPVTASDTEQTMPSGPSFGLVHRQLRDALHYADQLAGGSTDVFYVEAICEAMTTIATGNCCMEQALAGLYPPDSQAMEFDGLAGATWHDLAVQWLARSLDLIATATGRSVVSKPNDEGGFRVQLLPPLLGRHDLWGLGVSGGGSRRLDAKLVDEYRRVLNGGSRTQKASGDLAETPGVAASTGRTSTHKRAASDDDLPKAKRADSPSRVKARSAYEYAMERIPDACQMTIAELHAAIIKDGEAAAMVPDRPDTFGKYLRDCGIKVYKTDAKAAGGSVVRRSDL
ncbi:hypothetical protein [Crateriforma conspicua]|uniref:hypothetical protein n=1 Tax=Crateriforma conspicua TaxID=2527996 RepID=UPI001187938F|nr:hypothetical protein [Crateriforma conspicua]QDV60932.1 hypothetical protein Mal65_00530 [Crateriforma conspicua]